MGRPAGDIANAAVYPWRPKGNPRHLSLLRGWRYNLSVSHPAVADVRYSRFKIEDEHSFQNMVGSRELLSWACIRLDRLRSGYRFVGLLDPKGIPIPNGKLLVKVEKIQR